MEFNEIIASYNEAEDLINIGAYVKGSNPQIDHALSKIQSLRGFLKQDIYEKSNFEETVGKLEQLIEKPLGL
jgi:flagellum-specific ATP synthase